MHVKNKHAEYWFFGSPKGTKSFIFNIYLINFQSFDNQVNMFRGQSYQDFTTQTVQKQSKSLTLWKNFVREISTEYLSSKIIGDFHPSGYQKPKPSLGALINYRYYKNTTTPLLISITISLLKWCPCPNKLTINVSQNQNQWITPN